MRARSPNLASRSIVFFSYRATRPARKSRSCVVASRSTSNCSATGRVVSETEATPDLNSNSSCSFLTSSSSSNATCPSSVATCARWPSEQSSACTPASTETTMPRASVPADDGICVLICSCNCIVFVSKRDTMPAKNLFCFFSSSSSAANSVRWCPPLAKSRTASAAATSFDAAPSASSLSFRARTSSYCATWPSSSAMYLWRFSGECC
mmetsp:Transcript_31181/g.85471  ORF Transcript_31181/g.85471 Transcript_31181/m.85471 type:complete len:209 (+) Transcript_31181:804-1430(+)